MEPIQWISTLSALVVMMTAWVQARRAGLELVRARERANAAAKSVEAAPTSEEREFAANLVISPDLLEAYVKDIERVESRFANLINDQTYTPAQIDQEEKTARDDICKHLGRIREFNAGRLPSGRLENLWVSFGCTQVMK